MGVEIRLPVNRYVSFRNARYGRTLFEGIKVMVKASHLITGHLSSLMYKNGPLIEIFYRASPVFSEPGRAGTDFFLKMIVKIGYIGKSYPVHYLFDR
jgi:hypothetical protein